MTVIAEDDRSAGALLHRGVLVLLISVVSGVLVAGAMFPLVGGLGLVARKGADSFNQLPEGLEEPPLPLRSRILAADGSVLATLYLNENRIVVPLAAIPVTMQRAILAIEDHRFYQHAGVDFKSLVRALVRNQQEGAVTQGGSTITQQYVKNVLIESAVGEDGKRDAEGVRRATERSTGRKLREARYALALEKRYPKSKILEKYLNIAYFGQGVYGVATAAQHYFSKPVQQLTVDEAALLAGMVKNPARYDPEASPTSAKNAKARRDLVLDEMAEQGFLKPAEAAAAKARPIRLRKSTLASDCGLTTAPFFCAYVRQALLDDERYIGGATKDERIALLFQGGLTIRTTLDPKVQRAAQAGIGAVLRPAEAAQAAAAVALVEPGTGHVKALASNQRYGNDAAKGETEVNHALGGTTGFQAGSTFKTFFLVAAVKQGIPLGLRLRAPARYTTTKPGYLHGGRPYTVPNYDLADHGVVDMARATWSSLNTYYIQLAERTGLDEPVRLAEQMGITRWPIPKGGATVLGSADVSPLQMAEAYATLAARGVHCPATPIVSITDRQGHEMYADDPAQSCQRVLDPEDADTVNSVLRGVVTSGTGRAAAVGLGARPVAGKTGTSNDYGTAWFVGYSRQLAGAVYMGHPKYPRRFPLRNFRGRRVSGGSFPAQIWAKVMAPAHTGLPVAPFPTPPAGAWEGQKVALPDVRGLTATEAFDVLAEAGFVPRIDPRRVSAAPIAAGLVGATSPPPGSPATPGSVVLIFLSDGTAPRPSPTPTGGPAPTGGPTPTTTPTANPQPTCKPPEKKNCPSESPSPDPTPTGSPTPQP